MRKLIKNVTPVFPKKLSEKITSTLTNYVKTQFLLIALITAASWALLTLLNVRYALLLSMLTGALSIAPVVGIMIAAATVALVAIFDGVRFLPNLPNGLEGLVILLIYGVLNIIMDYFLSPYLMGKTTKVNPLLLLLGIILGTAAFGILGALFVVPILLVVKTIIDHYSEVTHTK